MDAEVVPLKYIFNQYGLAKRYGVGKAAVGNWRIRYANFPQPLDMPGVSGIPLFDVRQVDSWYDRQG